MYFWLGFSERIGLPNSFFGIHDASYTFPNNIVNWSQLKKAVNHLHPRNKLAGEMMESKTSITAAQWDAYCSREHTMFSTEALALGVNTSNQTIAMPSGLKNISD
jgi:ATP-dependent protease ClpP protease subunit